MLFYSNPQVVLQEIPGEVSLAFSISGCSLRCSGCHSVHTWANEFGSPLTLSILDHYIQRYVGLISCILFYGGEWEIAYLESLVDLIKKNGVKVALYTGEEMDYFQKKFLHKLDFIKTGRYIKELGGIQSIGSNQAIFENRHGHFNDITHTIRRHSD
jgi:anaerobic ribonucleoside-triphosphate reductase activating protein